VLFDRHGRSDGKPEPPAIVEQGDGADPLGRVGDRAGQPHPQLGAASGDRQPHPPTVQLEGAVVEPDRHQGALATREAGLLLAAATSFGRLVPGVGVAAKHRPRSDRRQLCEAALAGELAAQLLVVGDRWLSVLEALPVVIEQPGPDVASGAQQPVAAVGLVTGGAQADVGGAIHQTSGGSDGSHGELMFDAGGPPVKSGRGNVEKLPVGSRCKRVIVPSRNARELTGANVSGCGTSPSGGW
jgi:hypothetical protein